MMHIWINHKNVSEEAEIFRCARCGTSGIKIMHHIYRTVITEYIIRKECRRSERKYIWYNKSVNQK